MKSRLRLEAASSILHLSTVDKFSEATAPLFLTVALTIQDSCYEVREGFQDKLLPLIAARKLPVRFNIIPFLTAHDPMDELRNKARSFVMLQTRRLGPGARLSIFNERPVADYGVDARLALWEMPFIRLLHALAHHPDFGLDEEKVVDMAKSVNFGCVVGTTLTSFLT